jgi:hypothetical protein
MELKRVARRAAYAVVTIACLAYACLGAYAWWGAHEVRKDAESLLSEIRAMRPGSTPIADVESLVRTHKKFLMKEQPSGRENVRYFDFEYRNGLLSRLYLAPQVIFGVRLQVVNATLDVTNVGIASLSFRRYCEVHMFDFPEQSTPTGPAYRVTHHDGSISIHLNPDATPEQREEAYAFNLKCLDRIGGCRGETELWLGTLPSRGKAK